MILLLLVTVGLAIAIVLGLAAAKPDTFRYERSIVIEATPEEIYPYLSDIRKSLEWSPWEEKDPAMNRRFGVLTEGVGALYAWDGNGDIGAGNLEIVEATPDRTVKMRLEFIRPMKAINTAEYTIKPQGDGQSEVVWSMYGETTFPGKIVSVFIDCEKMIGAEFEKGLAKLKEIVER